MGGLTATTTDTTVGYAGSSNSLVGLNTNHSHSQTNNLTFSLADYVKSFFVFRSRPGGEPQIPSDLNTLQRSTCCRKHRPGGEIHQRETSRWRSRSTAWRSARSLPPGGNPIITCPCLAPLCKLPVWLCDPNIINSINSCHQLPEYDIIKDGHTPYNITGAAQHETGRTERED